jgi:hypothetical protein
MQPEEAAREKEQQADFSPAFVIVSAARSKSKALFNPRNMSRLVYPSEISRLPSV